MHTMSKNKLSSEEMGTVKKRSRNPTEVLTGDGEVHTHEEGQLFVHDLNQFVTVPTTRRNASCPIARQALRKPRMLL